MYDLTRDASNFVRDVSRSMLPSRLADVTLGSSSDDAAVRMWQPNRRQWAIIWATTMLLVLAWPPASGRSLGIKMLNLAVDPTGSLPTYPPPLPVGLADDGDAVAPHDALGRDDHRGRHNSAMDRARR